MNLAKAIEIEGHGISEYVRLTTTANPVQYIVGTTANATLLGSWPLEGSLPQEGHRWKFYAATDTRVAFVPLWMIQRQAGLPPSIPATLPIGLPVFQLIPKSTPMTFDVRAVWIFIVADVAQATGNLDVWVEG